MDQDFRIMPGRALRRRGRPFGEFDGPELRSEEFDSDEEYALAMASWILEELKLAREVEDNEYADLD